MGLFSREKILSFLVSVLATFCMFCLFGFVLAFLLLEIPLVALQIVSALFFVYAVVFAFLSVKSVSPQIGIAKIGGLNPVLFFSLALYIQVIRRSLLGHGGGGKLFCVKLAEGLFRSELSLVSLFMALGCMLFLLVFACKKILCKSAEVYAKVSLDLLGCKLFDICQDVNAGKITEAEANARKEQVRTEADFYSGIETNCRFLFEVLAAFSVLTFIHFAAGIVVDVAIGQHGFLAAFFENVAPVAACCIFPCALYCLYVIVLYKCLGRGGIKRTVDKCV